MKNKINISEMFLNFFHKKKHKIIKGSSLIPYNDKSLLFTNAGMNQFKEYFLGYKKSPYSRITTIQKCIRVGGKHNDLKNVGFTNRHHTFFKMLGNFSFGDYFKKEAIFFAWELLTSSKWFNLKKEKIFVTVYYKDIETYNIWYKDIGISKKKIFLIKDKNNIIFNSDNFWQMSETGPCGPSTEIFYDLGNNLKKNINNNLEERFLEIWNIVFIQFNKDLDGKLIPLPIKSVDTGMGLERISSILEGVNSNYKINIFQKIIKNTANLINIKDLENNSLKVIADHIRSSIYLISENIIPNNEKRGYILRKIIRRAINHGKILGEKGLFFYKLVKIYINNLENNKEKIFLSKKFNLIKNIIKKEEKDFNKIINKGNKLLDLEIKKLKNKYLSGKKIFYLYDTFGLSPELIKNICINKNINFNEKEFIQNMNIQREKSRKNNIFIKKNIYYKNKISKFNGYINFFSYSKILDIYKNDKSIYEINEGDVGEIILDITPFFGESGGQIGDIGYLKKDEKNIFQVNKTKKIGDLIIHKGKMILGSLKKDDNLYSKINKKYRIKLSRNHTATHLLHSSLLKLFGETIKQKGSLITDKYLRFDFSYNNDLKLKDIFNIEKIINHYIYKNIPIKIEKKKEIINKDNNNKYKNIIRIVNIKNISKELCCGTHLSNTQEIGFFIITKFLNIANGIKRIHAITHNLALKYVQKQNENIKFITNLFKIKEKDIVKNILSYKEKFYILQNNLKQLEKYISLQAEKKLLKNNILINDINLIISGIYYLNPKIFNYMIKNIINKFKQTIIILSTKWEKKIFLIIKITLNINNNINAIETIKKIFDKNICKINGCANIAQVSINLNKDKYYFYLSKLRIFILNKINKLH
ncbi:alanine--tRNA ligase [Enterobacteriaceae endosymbiont of Donacia semicuprea]|uniref:alanine--tRNA ligase n=1 Tax=Enterobacteriaceae endosymbiont of Donacia semicuprea TaxID=2675783 RepID=UPI00144A0ED5|nr:alanine--tRNA ligase [Enterobacteriaceae endosymbiont of Donacia semicuprea]QJC32726.1 alanine--tRNA ligase [Enterobacteriaceae endosymbiont of Donacia semicuprea]